MIFNMLCKFCFTFVHLVFNDSNWSQSFTKQIAPSGVCSLLLFFSQTQPRLLVLVMFWFRFWFRFYPIHLGQSGTQREAGWVRTEPVLAHGCGRQAPHRALACPWL